MLSRGAFGIHGSDIAKWLYMVVIPLSSPILSASLIVDFLAISFHYVSAPASRSMLGRNAVLIPVDITEAS
jgi:ABC-type maltose transport system permease subunit